MSEAAAGRPAEICGKFDRISGVGLSGKHRFAAPGR